MTDPNSAPDGDASRAPGEGGAPGRRLVDLPPSGPAASRPIAAPPMGQRERRTRNVGWRSRDVIRAAALVFALYVVGKLLWFANSLVFVVFLGTLFGLAVGAAVDRVERMGFKRRGVASALIVFGTLGILIGTGALMAPTLTEQFGVLRRQIPASLDRAQRWIDTHPNSPFAMAAKSLTAPAPGEAAAAPPPTTTAPPTGATTTGTTGATRTTTGGTDARSQQIADRAAQQAAQRTAGAGDAGAPSATQTLTNKLSGQLSRASGYLFGFLSSVGAVTAGLVLIIFLAIYIGAEPTLYHDGLMHLFPHRARRRAGEVLTEMATVLRKWLVVQLIAMVVIGVVTTVAMLLLNVKAAFALGFIAGILEFIPTVGPILAAVPAIAMGFVDGPEKAFVVVLAYWGIQFLENNLLIPALMRGGMDLPPALTLVAQALMTLVFGFLGLMVAVPLTAAILVPIKMLYVRDVVGDDIPLMSDNSEDEPDDDDED